MKKLLGVSLVIVAMALLAAGCKNKSEVQQQPPVSEEPMEATTTETQPVSQ